jgi:predicted nucleic acid-binding protein
MDMIVYLETKSKLTIQGMIKNGRLELIWSEILDFENIEMDDSILEKARELLELGLRQKDASHIACAIFGKANYFVTTDKKILNKKVQNIELINPIDFLRSMYVD